MVVAMGRYDTSCITQWRRFVAFIKATNLIHQAMHAVQHRRIVMAIKTANKVGTCFIFVELIVTLAAAWAIRSK